jgi:uncharacterized protein HemX
MNLLSVIIQHKFQALVILLMGLILSGMGILIEQQRQNQVVLSTLLNKKLANSLETNENKKLMELLKNIQATQVEQNAILGQLLSTSKAQALIKIPASKMNKFKSGSYKLSKGKTW